MTERAKVGLERTILCATRLWSIDNSIYGGYRRGATRTPTLLQGVKHVVRKQGFTTPAIDKAIRKLEAGGFLHVNRTSRKNSTIALTQKGGRVGCASVKLAPWTNREYTGSQLKGCKRCR